MRMLQVTDYGSPFAGSFVPMLRAALDEAERRGWSAQAVLPERAREREWLADLGPHRERLLFAPPGSRTEHGRWLADVVDSEPGPTVLHSHFTVFNIPAVAVARRRPDVSVYWHVHTVLSERMAARARNRLSLGVVARQVERILCVAPHLADGVRARGAPADKVRYFPNALDAGAYARRSDAERAEVRARLGLPAGVPVLLHFGRDWYAKGGDLFLHALRILRDGGFPDAVAAASRGGDPARELAAELDLTDALHVLDHVPLVADLYAASDLLMATSRGEGMPLTVLEALASGMGVVASDIPGHHLPGGDPPGVAVVESEPQALATAAERLLARPAGQAAAEGQQAAAWVRSEMDLDSWARRLFELYEGDLAVRASAGRRWRGPHRRRQRSTEPTGSA